MLESGKWKVESVKRWLRWLPLLLTLSLFHPFTTAAQEMRVDGFEKLKKGPMNMNHVVTDKQQAILDLKTGEKGFSFLADGKTEIAAEENDGMLTLKTPDKTRFVVMKHADYGQLTWKAPLKKGLRKKKHYAATLLTFSPEKNYQLQEQWAVFDTQPWDVILTVDSTMTTVHGGRAQMFLPIGKHTWKAESPFYMQEEGSFELTDEERLNVAIALQPVYSYLTVKTPCPDCEIYVDGQHIGQAQATSGHLREGVHHLTLMRGDQPYYEGDFSIGWKEKKTIELTMEERGKWKEESGKRKEESGKWKEESEGENDVVESVARSVTVAPVTIKALDDSTAIWVNRELKGYGHWEGSLEAGFYLISTEKDGVESRSTTLWITDSTPQKLELLAPMNSYGILNVHCNEIGAEVYINGRLAGLTPCVVKDLPADRRCMVTLVKNGFFKEEKEVQVPVNDMMDVKMKLRKR